MSTDYEVFKKHGVSLTIEEASNCFELRLDNEEGPGSVIGHTEGFAPTLEEAYTWGVLLTPEELWDAALQMLRVASYWMDAKPLKGPAQKFIQDL